jgi:hypothetical protein
VFLQSAVDARTSFVHPISGIKTATMSDGRYGKGYFYVDYDLLHVLEELIILIVDTSYWFYAPNKGAAIFFCVAFCSSGCLHIYQCM